MSRSRYLTFGVVCLLAVGLAGAVIVRGMGEAESARQPTTGTVQDRALDLAAVRAGAHIMFVSTALGPTFGMLAAVPLDDPDGPRAVTDIACERVAATRDRTLCLSADRGFTTTYEAFLLSPDLSRGPELPISGIPSRARLSADGRLAAMTAFVSGHSYAEAGFSTATTVHDAMTGESYGNIEEFTVIRDGEEYRAVDLNMWGVTFAGGNRFYATVASGGRTWLAEGDLADHTLRILREGVECPSLSPDGTRIAYKFKTGGASWQVHVLDLASGEDVALAETRSVDDQVAWLDDAQVMYGLPREGSAQTDVWVVPADGSGTPRLLVPRAWSPSAVR